MRIAVIDMGTNTFNLLIADQQQRGFTILYSDRYPVKLGQKLQEQHQIDPEGIVRILQVLQIFQEVIHSYQVDKTLAFATSSIRTAKNQSEILKKIKQLLNINVQVIDGDREAELIYYACQYAIQTCMDTAIQQPFLIMDIGGGSTEFILANTQSPIWKQSFLLGMARLIDELQPSDPMRAEDIQNIFSYLDKMLFPLHHQVQKHKPRILVGSSGVFDSVVEMIEANVRPIEKTDRCGVIYKNDFDAIYQKILPLTYAERLQFKGLVAMRADMIVISLTMIDYVLQKLGIEKIMISFYSLKEGVVVEDLLKHP